MNWRFEDPWEDSFRLVAQCVDRLTEAESIIADIAHRTEEIADKYQEAIAGKTFARILDGLDNNQIWVHHGSDADQILLQMHLSKTVDPANVPDGDKFSHGFNLSRERLDLIDADVILAHSYDYESVTQSSQLLRDPLFQRLRAAQKGLVFTIPSPYWYLGGAIGIPLVLQDLDTVILPRLANTL